MSGALTAPLATLVFLSVFWLLLVVGAAALEESGAKIAAALRGESSTGACETAIVGRRRGRIRPSQPRLVEGRLRAAA